MLTFPMHSRTAWSDYFTGNPTFFQGNTYTSRETPSHTNLYISNSLFLSITSTSEGGALYSSNSVKYLLIESTSFFSCKTSNHYGAIYFYHSSGESVLNEVCGYDCSSTSGNHHQFAYIQVYDTATSKNHINYSSIVRCVNEISSSHYIFYPCYGKICCPSVNLSMNKCYYLINFQPYSDSSSVTSLISYSTFADNHAIGHTGFVLWRGYAKYEFKSCNIIRNTQVYTSSHGTFLSYGYLTIENSCILENNANYVVHSAYSNYPATLSNCTVDKTASNGYLTIKNTVTKSFILALNHMSTQNCHSKYDSAGYLTPITPHPPSPTKQIRLCTCGECYSQFRLRDFVFLFNFIYLGSSSNALY
jgi:hypothetical protein